MNITHIHTSWTCPHCGWDNYPIIPVDDYIQLQLAYCDDNDGGCGKMVAIGVPWKIEVPAKVYNLIPVEDGKEA